MAHVQGRLKAESLRRQGESIGDIANELSVSKSTVSIWCRDIALTEQQKKLLLQKSIKGGLRGRLLGAAANQKKKADKIGRYINDGKNYAKNLSARELLLCGIGIYWGEGSKIRELSFINSDKDMIMFMYRWFRIVFGIKKESFILRIFINDLHKHRKKVIEEYWSNLLGLPTSQFRKTIFIKRKSKKRYSNHDQYFGLLSLRIRNSTDLKYRILGLIEGLKYSKF